MTLQSITDALWCADATQSLPGGFEMPARMVVIRLDDGLWIHSPIPIDDTLAAELDALGPVRHLVAPNCFHHLHMAPAAARWPHAKVYAPPGLRSKRPDLRVDVELHEGARPWRDVLMPLAIAGAPALDEFVFLHQPSASLIVCDLVFNVHEGKLTTRLVLRMVGVWRRLAQSRIWRRYTKDRGAAARSCERVLEHEFTRVIPSHGRIAEGPEVRAAMRDGMAWMLAGR